MLSQEYFDWLGGLSYGRDAKILAMANKYKVNTDAHSNRLTTKTPRVKACSAQVPSWRPLRLALVSISNSRPLPLLRVQLNLGALSIINLQSDSHAVNLEWIVSYEALELLRVQEKVAG